MAEKNIGKIVQVIGPVIDVEFDHRPGEVSLGHFADRVEVINV